MRRYAFTLAVVGVVVLMAACGTSQERPTESGGDAASSAPSASSPVGSTSGDADPTPVFAWTFGGDVATEAGDVDLELLGDFEFVEGAVALDGRTGFGASVDPAPLRTTSSFSVSAWVTLADPVEFATVVSQLGTEAAAFYLGVGESTWDFAMKDADTNEPGHTIRAKANPGLVDTGRWFHLVGVHDADEAEIRLYVNGVLGGAVAFDRPWQAEGELTIGRAQAHFAPSDFWPGAIASIAIYTDALTTDQVRDIRGSTEPTGAPPAMASTTSALTGTWDYAFDDAGREIVLEDFTGLVGDADEVVTRFGFNGNDWWQGYLFDGELFLLHGVPEGDGGSFVLVPGEPVIAMYGAGGQARIVYEWSIDGDSLTLTAVEECAVSGSEMTCTEDRSEMDPIMLLVTDQTFTRSGDDPGY